MIKYLKTIGLLFIFVNLFYSNLFSQIELKGFVKDSLNKPIVSASVTIQNKQNNLIVAYAMTNAKGSFQIRYNTHLPPDSFYVLVNCLGYAAKRFSVIDNNQTIECLLQAGNINLPNVTVQNSKPLLKVNGDTLNYNVDSFKNVQDRTIGDVLRKMPGIDVDANGKISYNGKAISNFYIDGDNLLDDKYNLATNSINADMVDKVQVLENHQPIKALKDVTVSNKVALNLSLKDKARLKLSTRAELGAGIENIYDETANVMAFKKNYKAINSLKANNSGSDVSDDIISHNIMDYLRQIENDAPQNLLNVSAVGNPNLSKQRYLFNNAVLINANNLFKTQKGVQLKANVYCLYDNQNSQFANLTQYYLPSDTAKYSEQQNTTQTFNNLRFQFNINSNKNNYYLNNTLLTEINNTSSSSSLISNGYNQFQNLDQKFNNFSNEFNLITSNNRKSVLEYYSYINYLNKPESVKIEPGINENIFNNGFTYKALMQEANVPTFFINSYFNYRKPFKRVLQSYKTGIISQWQQLPSAISIIQQNNQTISAKDSFSNHLNWQRYKLYAQADYDLVLERMQIGISLPVNWQNIHYSDWVLKRDETFCKPFFAPSLRIKYQTGIEHFISASYNYNNTIANIENVYSGYILKNFQLIGNNEIAFQQQFVHTINVGVNFRKSIKIFFANLGVSYSFNNSNSINNSVYYSNIQKQTIVPLTNNVNNMSIVGGISKYIFSLHTTLAVRGSYQISNWNQLQNSSLLTYKNTGIFMNTTLNTKFSRWLNANYIFSYSDNSSKNLSLNNTGSISKTKFIQQQLVANVIVNSDFYIKLSEDFNTLKQTGFSKTDYFFSDVSAVYKLNKLKADLSLSANNIFNEQQYFTASVSGNSFSQSQYRIRPRMLLLKISFNF